MSNAEKQKKSIYKSWWFVAIIVIIAIGVVGCGGGKDNEAEIQPTEQVGTNAESEAAAPKEPVEDNVPREHKNALRAAQNYVDIMAFSEVGLYNQLTSEYGDKYPAEAAQYAIENVVVDYNKEALEAAKNYLEAMPMSDSELFEQLTSDYGDQFTKEQAQYAIDNL